jgi:hypothetical protein
MNKHKAGESEAEKESKLRCDICLKNEAEYYPPRDKERLSPLTLWGLATLLRKEGRFDPDKPRQLRMCDSCLEEFMKGQRETELESKLFE